MLRAEIKWGLHAHGQGDQRAPWELPWIQGLVDFCHRWELNSLLEMDLAECRNGSQRMIAKEIAGELRLIYLTPADTRAAGFIQTQHFGVLFPARSGYYPLTEVPQQWLRDLLWDHLIGVLGSPRCPRTATFRMLRLPWRVPWISSQSIWLMSHGSVVVFASSSCRTASSNLKVKPLKRPYTNPFMISANLWPALPAIVF